jgi:hypothetical protein
MTLMYRIGTDREGKKIELCSPADYRQPASHLRLFAFICGSILCGLLPSLAAGGMEGPPRVDTLQDRHPRVRRDREGNLVFRNRHLVAMLVREQGRYGRLLVHPATRPAEASSRAAAEAPVLALIRWREGEMVHDGVFSPVEARISGDDRVALRGTVKEGGTEWAAEATLGIGEEPWLSWEFRLRPSAPARLARFTPLPLRAGHEGPREVLFPGVLYADEAEPTLVEPGLPAPERRVPRGLFAPDPHRVTIPLIALSQDDVTVGLLWDNRQSWGGPGYPGALLDTRQLSETEPSHRIEVYVPAVTGPAKESEEPAAEPVAVAAGVEVRLTGKVVVIREVVDPTEAIRQWVRAYGVPRSEGLPRGAVMSNVQFQMSNGGAASPQVPSLDTAAQRRLLLRLIDTGLRGKSAVRGEAERLAEELRKQGPLDPRLAYRVGGVLPSLDAERERVMEIVREQLATGGWPWAPGPPGPPGSEMQPPTDVSGPMEIGVVTSRALPILRYAALTGDSDAAGPGLRALEYIDRTFRVPRASQAGEAPRGAPDLLTAAEAAECFLLGYRISGEERFLTRARYWADTGLTFVYFWGEKERPAMKHATLPIFGDSYAGRPWSGQAVQWRGLVFGRVLRELARVRPDELYEEVYQGILASAMRQQYTSGESTGQYPEFWDIRQNKGEGVKLGPELILALMYSTMGYDPEVSHARVRVGPDRMFVASGATIKEADTTAMRLRLKFHWLENHDAITTITGVPSRPVSVEYNTGALRNIGVPIPRQFQPEAAQEEEPGWYYDPEGGLLVLRLKHTGGNDNLEIRWPDSRFRSPVDRVDTKVRPRRQ